MIPILHGGCSYVLFALSRNLTVATQKVNSLWLFYSNRLLTELIVFFFADIFKCGTYNKLSRNLYLLRLIFCPWELLLFFASHSCLRVSNLTGSAIRRLTGGEWGPCIGAALSVALVTLRAETCVFVSIYLFYFYFFNSFVLADDISRYICKTFC